MSKKKGKGMTGHGFTFEPPPGFGDDDISRAMRPCAICGGSRLRGADDDYYCPACLVREMEAEIARLRGALERAKHDFSVIRGVGTRTDLVALEDRILATNAIFRIDATIAPGPVRGEADRLTNVRADHLNRHVAEEALEWIRRSILHDAKRCGDLGDGYATIEEHNAEVTWLQTTADALIGTSYSDGLPLPKPLSTRGDAVIATAERRVVEAAMAIARNQWARTLEHGALWAACDDLRALTAGTGSGGQ